MAEEKSSFTAYCDWGNTLDEMTDQQAGILMKHLFDYVRDKDPEAKDLLTKVAFAPMKSTLKRDLKKWKIKAIRNKENGCLGGRPKNPNNPNNPGVNLKTKGLKKEPKKPVSVSVSVSDSVSVLLEKETKGIFKDWIDYRKEIKKPIKSDKTKISLAKKIQAAGYIKSKKVIETSISNGWQGLFWDSNENVKYLNNEKQPTINRQTADTIRSNSEGWTVKRN